MCSYFFVLFPGKRSGIRPRADTKREDRNFLRYCLHSSSSVVAGACLKYLRTLASVRGYAGVNVFDQSSTFQMHVTNQINFSQGLPVNT